MMNTTHAAMGVTLAAGLAALAPEYAGVAAAAAIAGGVFPDLDLVVGEHRKTLHFPACYSLAGLAALVVAARFPAAATVGTALFLLSAGVHSVSDAFGGGLEARPWEPTDDRGVYLRPWGTWIAPRRWIRYDGAPEDLLAAALFSVPAFVAFGPEVRTLAAVGLAISVVYTAFRKKIPDRDVPFLR